MNLLYGDVHTVAPELDLLASTVAAAGDGNHLEIGTCWGGTAIVAADAKAQAGCRGKVVCVEPFVFGDWPPGDKPTLEKVQENIDAAGHHDRVEIHVGLSDPWPFPRRRRFASAFIDGDHQAPWPETDWANISRVCPLILLHDVGRETACTALHERVSVDSDWTVRDAVGSLYVYEKAS